MKDSLGNSRTDCAGDASGGGGGKKRRAFHIYHDHLFLLRYRCAYPLIMMSWSAPTSSKTFPGERASAGTGLSFVSTTREDSSFVVFHSDLPEDGGCYASGDGAERAPRNPTTKPEQSRQEAGKRSDVLTKFNQNNSTY